MNEIELGKANKLQKEIHELESFIRSAEQVWTGKLVKRTYKYIFRSSAYGIYNEKDYFMNTEIKNKVLDVLREHLTELKRKLEEL